MNNNTKLKVAFTSPTRDRPTDAYLKALEASVPLLDAEGFEHAAVNEVGCPYISGARATMIRKAMLWGADVIVFIDDDVSWAPEDLVMLLKAEGDVVAGTYRFKVPGAEAYMGECETDSEGHPIVREDGAVRMTFIPAGFLKVTRKALDRFMEAFPELVIDADNKGFKSPDLFNHGAYRGVWHGEDYMFSRRWREIGGEIWLLPKLRLDHNGRGADADKVWKGCYHDYLRRLPGGDLATNA